MFFENMILTRIQSDGRNFSSCILNDALQGFYVNATKAPYSTHYHMYNYVTNELPNLLKEHFCIGNDNLRSITGHSMVRIKYSFRQFIVVGFEQ